MALARTRRLSDIPTGHDGKAYLMVDGRRYEAFLVSKMSINFETIPDEKRFLQERMTQHAARGGNITGSITYYNCTSALVKAIEDWKNGGADYPDITIQAYASVSGIGPAGDSRHRRHPQKYRSGHAGRLRGHCYDL